MKSKNGTFVFIKPHILITGNSRRIIVGWKDSVTGHFALSLNCPFILSPSELRELADFIEELQKENPGK